MSNYTCDECYGWQRAGWEGGCHEKKGGQGGLMMRRNREEAVETGNISSLSLLWPKDKGN